jgi:hypothetical protein
MPPKTAESRGIVQLNKLDEQLWHPIRQKSANKHHQYGEQGETLLNEFEADENWRHI